MHKHKNFSRSIFINSEHTFVADVYYDERILNPPRSLTLILTAMEFKEPHFGKRK
jgi:hypothetical protein